MTAQTAVHRPPSQWFGNNDRIDDGDSDGGVGMLTTNTMDSRDCISTPWQSCVDRGHPFIMFALGGRRGLDGLDQCLLEVVMFQCQMWM